MWSLVYGYAQIYVDAISLLMQNCVLEWLALISDKAGFSKWHATSYFYWFWYNMYFTWKLDGQINTNFKQKSV